MARRNPGVPGFGDMPGNGDNPWSGGDLDLSADGARQMPAGNGIAGFSTTIPMSSQVQLTKDEAVSAAIEGLRSDMRTLADMNSKFSALIDLSARSTDHLANIRREAQNQSDDLLTAINRMAERLTSQTAGDAGVPRSFTPEAGNNTAGYTTLNNINASLGGAIPGGPWGYRGYNPVQLYSPPLSGNPFVASGGGVITGGSSPGSGLAPRPFSGFASPGRSVTGGGAPLFGGGGGSNNIPPYNAGSGPGPGHIPNPIMGPHGFHLPTTFADFVNVGRWAFNQPYEQRAENERFQQIEGGSNFDGFGERIHRSGFRFNHLGLSSKDDNEIFNDITGFGITGGERNRLGDQVYHAKMVHGIGINESVDALTAAARSASPALNTVIDGLQRVTKSAHDFGENAIQVRKKFTDTLNQVIGNTSISGTAAVGTAQAITQSTAALGRYGLNVNPTDYVTGANQQALLLTAASAGLSYKAADTMARDNPAKFQALSTANITATIEQYIGHDATEYAKKALASYGDGVPNYQAVGQGILDRSTLPSQTLYQTISNLLPGVQIPFNSFGAWIAQQLSQSGLSSTFKKRAIAATTYQDSKGTLRNTSTGAVATDTNGRVIKTTPQSDDKNQVALSDRHGVSDSSFNKLAGAGLSPKIEGVTNTTVGNLESGKQPGYLKSESGDADLKHFKGSKIPQLETLGRHFKNLKNVYVKLGTSQGPLIMSLDQAINAYPAVVASGTPLIVSGGDEDNNKTISEILGGDVLNTPQNQADADAEYRDKGRAAKVQTHVGSNLSLKQTAVNADKLQGASKDTYNKYGLGDLYKSQQKQSAASGGAVVTLSHDARKLLKLMGPDSNPSANAGVPASNSTNASRGGPSDPSTG